MRKWWKKTWSKWNYVWMGIFNGALGEKRNTVEEPFTKILTIFGLFMFAIVIFVMILGVALHFLVFINTHKYGEKYEEMNVERYLDRIFPPKLCDKLAEKLVLERPIDLSISFHEKYLYFKYYYKVAKFVNKRNWYNYYALDKLEHEYNIAYKNFLISKLVGIENE